MPAAAPRLFAILDCAVDPRLYEHAARLEPRASRCLFLGKLHPEVKQVSPHLVELSPDDPLARLWQAEGWGKAWGMLIASQGDLHRVWRRMRHFTQARLPSGEGPVLFRFWDPRVMRVYMPLVEGPDLEEWFKDVDSFAVEAEDGAGAIRYSLNGGALSIETAATGGGGMAELTIISETGMFHSACRCTFGQQSAWWGFKPRTHRAPAGPGLVDRSDRSGMINHLISFLVDDVSLRLAIDKAAADYATATYVLGVKDCVSFSADVARQAGLSVPAVNFTPYGFIAALAVWNKHTAWK